MPWFTCKSSQEVSGMLQGNFFKFGLRDKLIRISKVKGHCHITKHLTEFSLDIALISLLWISEHATEHVTFLKATSRAAVCNVVSELWPRSEDVCWLNMWILTENICWHHNDNSGLFQIKRAVGLKAKPRLPVRQIFSTPEIQTWLSLHAAAKKCIQSYLPVSWPSPHASCKWISMVKMSKLNFWEIYLPFDVSIHTFRKV